MDDIESMDERTAPEYGTALGVQIYSKNEIDLQIVPNLVDFNPYENEEAKACLKRIGVVFYRDAPNFQGAIADVQFTGDGYYSQFYIDKDSGELLKIFLKNKKKEILEITEKTVRCKKEENVENAKKF